MKPYCNSLQVSSCSAITCPLPPYSPTSHFRFGDPIFLVFAFDSAKGGEAGVLVKYFDMLESDLFHEV